VLFDIVNTGEGELKEAPLSLCPLRSPLVRSLGRVARVVAGMTDYRLEGCLHPQNE
jgi:hypothetical protein